MFACPNCGTDVPVGARACRECGSDATTGWQDSDEIDYASVDLPDGYRGDGEGHELPPVRSPRWVVWVALFMAALLLAGALGMFAWN
jgi:hypothetical protein